MCSAHGENPVCSAHGIFWPKIPCALHTGFSRKKKLQKRFSALRAEKKVQNIFCAKIARHANVNTRRAPTNEGHRAPRGYVPTNEDHRAPRRTPTNEGRRALIHAGERYFSVLQSQRGRAAAVRHYTLLRCPAIFWRGVSRRRSTYVQCT